MITSILLFRFGRNKISSSLAIKNLKFLVNLQKLSTFSEAKTDDSLTIQKYHAEADKALDYLYDSFDRITEKLEGSDVLYSVSDNELNNRVKQFIAKLISFPFISKEF